MAEEKNAALVLRQAVEEKLLKARALIEPALPKHVSFDAMMAKAFLEFHSNPDLRKDPPVAPVTVFWALVHAASLGLTVGRASEEAYLVPFRDKNNPNRRVQLVIGYKGLVKLAYQHPRIASINARTVFENDTFDIDLGTDPKIIFRPNMVADRGEVIGAFSVVEIRPDSGIGAHGKVVEVMTRRDIDKVRASSRGSDDPASPWNTWYEEMACKTALRRGLKRTPRSSELDRAIALEDAIESGQKPEGEIDIDEAVRRERKGPVKARIQARSQKVVEEPARREEAESDSEPQQDEPNIG